MTNAGLIRRSQDRHGETVVRTLVSSVGYGLLLGNSSKVCIEVSHKLQETGDCGGDDGVVELRLRPYNERGLP